MLASAILVPLDKCSAIGKTHCVTIELEIGNTNLDNAPSVDEFLHPQAMFNIPS